MYRVNITIETDEDDLLGVTDCKTIKLFWQNGPVIRQEELCFFLMKLTLLIKLCVYNLYRGNGVFIKKINKFVK